ncbi:MAG: MFS transporter [Myxococcales bacterium]|nr:MAG: MFS transporter [Myxococcales bacterium]
MVSSPLVVARPLDPPTSARRVRLSEEASFWLLASLPVSFLAGSSAPTPLYAVYQARWHFSPITTTVAFGIYALAVLASLLTLGRLSDHIGRRPVLLVAVSLQALVMFWFGHVASASELVLVRVVQGLSTGGALSAIGAGLVDLHRQRGTVANAVAPMLGTATGGIASGLLVRYLPAPEQLVYYLLGGVFAAQVLGVFSMVEPGQRRPGALASLRPQLGLPVELRPAFFVALPLLVASWALVGFYGSLGPALLGRLFGGGSVLLGGLSLFVIALSGATAVLALREKPARVLMLVGTTSLFVGVLVTLLAIAVGSRFGFFAGAAISGVGFGTGFQGAIRDLVPTAPLHARAGVLSVLLIVSYLAMGLPAMGAGFRVAATHDLLGTARELGSIVAALALLSLGPQLTRRRRSSPGVVA